MNVIGNISTRIIKPLTGLAVSLAILAGCAHTKMIPGTRIPDNKENRSIIKIVEKYRRAMIKRDMGTLMAMAHPHYYEHLGTHKGEDDYGYKGLLGVIRKRMQQVQAMRYNIKYRRMKWVSKKEVVVEIYIDAYFQMATAPKDVKWSHYADYNKVVLVKHKGRWYFLGGM